MHVSFTFTRNIPVASPQITLPPATRSESTAVQTSAITNISDEARQLDSMQGADTKIKTIALKDYLKKLDFDNISPNEMIQLGMNIVAAGELTPDQVASFMDISGDTEPPTDPNKKINVSDHFSAMLSSVTTAARTDSSLNFGVQWREESINILNAVKSFATSDRAHII